MEKIAQILSEIHDIEQSELGDKDKDVLITELEEEILRILQ